jgi:hypothetical protein
MSTRVRNYRFRLSGTLATAALSLLALAVPLSPAKAQCLGVDLGLVCAGLGLPSAFSHPYYYGYPNAVYTAYPNAVYTAYPNATYTAYPNAAYTAYPNAAYTAYPNATYTAYPYPYNNPYYPSPAPPASPAYPSYR